MTTIFEYGNAKVELDTHRRIFICTVGQTEKLRTGSYLSAEQWFYESYRFVV